MRGRSSGAGFSGRSASNCSASFGYLHPFWRTLPLHERRHRNAGGRASPQRRRCESWMNGPIPPNAPLRPVIRRARSPDPHRIFFPRACPLNQCSKMILVPPRRMAQISPSSGQTWSKSGQGRSSPSQFWPNWAKAGASLTEVGVGCARANAGLIGAIWGQIWPNKAEFWPMLVLSGMDPWSTRATFGSTFANPEPNLAEFQPNIGRDRPNFGRISALNWPIWDEVVTSGVSSMHGLTPPPLRVEDRRLAEHPPRSRYHWISADSMSI